MVTSNESESGDHFFGARNNGGDLALVAKLHELFEMQVCGLEVSIHAKFSLPLQAVEGEVLVESFFVVGDDLSHVRLFQELAVLLHLVLCLLSLLSALFNALLDRLLQLLLIFLILLLYQVSLLAQRLSLLGHLSEITLQLCVLFLDELSLLSLFGNSFSFIFLVFLFFLSPFLLLLFFFFRFLLLQTLLGLLNLMQSLFPLLEALLILLLLLLSLALFFLEFLLFFLRFAFLDFTKVFFLGFGVPSTSLLVWFIFWFDWLELRALHGFHVGEGWGRPLRSCYLRYSFFYRDFFVPSHSTFKEVEVQDLSKEVIKYLQ